MGLKNWIGLEDLEKENRILKEYIKNQNLIIQNIYAKTNQFKQQNLAVGYVGFERIKQISQQGLDYAAEKEIELANIK